MVEAVGDADVVAVEEAEVGGNFFATEHKNSFNANRFVTLLQVVVN